MRRPRVDPSRSPWRSRVRCISQTTDVEVHELLEEAAPGSLL